MRRTGQWLRAAAARICVKATMERLIDPIVADMQSECADAAGSGRAGRAAWVRVAGYAAFWKAVGLHVIASACRATWRLLAYDTVAMSRTLVIAFIAFVVMTLLFVAPPLLSVPSRYWLNVPMLALLLLPQAIPLSVPIAVPLGILLGRRKDAAARLTRGVVLLAIAGSAVAFVTQMWLVPHANQAWHVAVARERGAREIDVHSQRGMVEMSLSELAAGIREYDAGGFPEDAARFRFHYHLRFALPAATLVLSLLALGIGRVVRSRAFGIVAFVAALCGYYACLWLSDASKSLVPPIALLWAPNILFTALSLVLLRTSAHRPAG